MWVFLPLKNLFETSFKGVMRPDVILRYKSQYLSIQK